MNYETNYEFLKIISFVSFPRPSRKMPKNTAISSSVSRSSESQWVRTIESTKAFWKWNIPGAERSHRLLSNAPLEFQLLYFTLRIRLDAFAFFGTTILRTTFCRSLSALTWSPSEKAHSRQKSAHKRWALLYALLVLGRRFFKAASTAACRRHASFRAFMSSPEAGGTPKR